MNQQMEDVSNSAFPVNKQKKKDKDTETQLTQETDPELNFIPLKSLEKDEGNGLYLLSFISNKYSFVL